MKHNTNTLNLLQTNVAIRTESNDFVIGTQEFSKYEIEALICDGIIIKTNKKSDIVWATPATKQTRDAFIKTIRAIAKDISMSEDELKALKLSVTGIESCLTMNLDQFQAVEDAMKAASEEFKANATDTPFSAGCVSGCGCDSCARELLSHLF